MHPILSLIMVVLTVIVVSMVVDLVLPIHAASIQIVCSCQDRPGRGNVRVMAQMRQPHLHQQRDVRVIQAVVDAARLAHLGAGT
jgi:hypothetical protein